jgi:hypothetical protein
MEEDAIHVSDEEDCNVETPVNNKLQKVTNFLLHHQQKQALTNHRAMTIF